MSDRRAHRAAAAIRWAGAAALAIPWCIAGHYALHWAGIPGAWPVLLLVVTYAVFRTGRERGRDAHLVPGPTDPEGPRWVTWGLLALLVVPPALHALTLALKLGTQAHSTHFNFHDEAYELMIARGLQQGFPPPDLSYAGETVRYHYGLPLLVDLIHRATGVPHHTALHGWIHAMMAFACISSMLAIVRASFPAWTTARVLAAASVAFGFITLDGYNLVWHLRDILLHGAPLRTLFGGMPAMHEVSFSLARLGLPAAHIAIACMFAIVANLPRLGPVGLAAAMFGMYATKSQVALPACAMLAFAAAHRAWKHRSWQPALGFALGGLLIAITRWTVPSTDAGYQMAAGFNDYFLDFSRRTYPLVPTLTQQPWLGMGVVLASNLLGLHLYLLALCRAAKPSNLRANPASAPLLSHTLVLLAAAVGLLTVVRVQPSTETLGAFNAIHRSIADRLWLPFESYLPDMMQVSLMMALAPALALLALSASAFTLEWLRSSQRPVVQSLLVLVLVLASGRASFAYADSMLSLIRTQPLVPAGVPEILQAVEPSSGAIYTNDLEQHATQPLLNTLLPQLFGHQFYCTNFMFGTFRHPDAVQRLHDHEWFWKSPWSPAHLRFLRAHQIRWLLIDRRKPSPMDATTDPSLVVRKTASTHVLLEVLPP